MSLALKYCECQCLLDMCQKGNFVGLREQIAHEPKLKLCHKSTADAYSVRHC